MRKELNFVVEGDASKKAVYAFVNTKLHSLGGKLLTYVSDRKNKGETNQMGLSPTRIYVTRSGTTFFRGKFGEKERERSSRGPLSKKEKNKRRR